MKVIPNANPNLRVVLQDVFRPLPIVAWAIPERTDEYGTRVLAAYPIAPGWPLPLRATFAILDTVTGEWTDDSGDIHGEGVESAQAHLQGRCAEQEADDDERVGNHCFETGRRMTYEIPRPNSFGETQSLRRQDQGRRAMQTRPVPGR